MLYLYLRAGPDPRHVSQLVGEARYLFPGLEILRVVGDSCVTLNTPDKFAPFLDSPRPGLVIAGAGCGHGAKGADEIGQSWSERQYRAVTELPYLRSDSGRPQSDWTVGLPAGQRTLQASLQTNPLQDMIIITI